MKIKNHLFTIEVTTEKLSKNKTVLGLGFLKALAS